MKEISLVHCSDIHLGKKRFQDRVEDDFFNALNQVVDFCLENNVDALLMAGDVFDHSQLEPYTLLKAEAILQRLKDADIPVLTIYGNHDGSFTKDEEFGWLNYLSQKGFIKFLRIQFQGNKAIVQPWNDETKNGGVYSFKGIKIYGTGFLGSSLEPRLKSLIPQIDNAPFNILLLHADLMARTFHDQGILKAESLISDLRAKIDYVALGHIHSRYDKDNWVYNPGSLENWRLQEWDYEKGFYHILINPETKNKEVTHYSISRRPTFVFDKDKSCDLEGCQNQNELYKRITAFINKHQTQIPDEAIIRMVLTGSIYISPGEIDLMKIKEAWVSKRPYHVEVINETIAISEDVLCQGEELSRDKIEEDELLKEINSNSQFRQYSEDLASIMQKTMLAKAEKLFSDEEIFDRLHRFRMNLENS